MKLNIKKKRLMSVVVTLMRDSKFQADMKLLFEMVGSKCSFIKLKINLIIFFSIVYKYTDFFVSL